MSNRKVRKMYADKLFKAEFSTPRICRRLMKIDYENERTRIDSEIISFVLSPDARRNGCTVHTQFRFMYAHMQSRLLAGALFPSDAFYTSIPRQASYY